MQDDAALAKQSEWAKTKIDETLTMMGRRIVGQQALAERLLVALMAEGHILLEGLPGLAKTTAVRTLADVSDLSVHRIQFTPDMLPADVVGTEIYDPRTAEFRIKRGPIFAHLVIADEINRAPAKVQSALLEAMQERQVTIGEQTFPLASPFLVMATQNPIEQEGTYPLPEAQVDRFLFKVLVTYGTPADEKTIMQRMASGDEAVLSKTLTAADLAELRTLARAVHVSDAIRDYIVRIVFATRMQAEKDLQAMSGLIAHGASPRASINLERAARAYALCRGRSYVVPQDVKDLALDVLRHRIILTYEAEAEGTSSDAVIARILATVDVP